jgi:hypothetical protein
MLGTFLKRLYYKDLKTVKTLKIHQSSAKMWRFKVRKKSIFSNKMADFPDFEAPYLCTALAHFQCFYSFEILIVQSLQKSS